MPVLNPPRPNYLYRAGNEAVLAKHFEVIQEVSLLLIAASSVQGLAIPSATYLGPSFVNLIDPLRRLRHSSQSVGALSIAEMCELKPFITHFGFGQ